MNLPTVLWRSSRLDLGLPLEFITSTPNGRYIFLNYSTRTGPCVQAFDTIRKKVIEYELRADLQFETGARVFFLFPVNNTEALISFFTPPNSINLAFCQIDHDKFSITLNGVSRRWMNDPNRLMVGGCSSASGSMIYLLYSDFDHFDQDDEHTLYTIDVVKQTISGQSIADFPAEGACPMAVVGDTLWLLPEETIMTLDEENGHEHSNKVCAFSLRTGTFHWLPTFGSHPVADSAVSLFCSGDALWLKARDGIALWRLDLSAMYWTRLSLTSSFDPVYTSFTVDTKGFGYFYRTQTASDRTAFVARLCLEGVVSLQVLALNAVLDQSYCLEYLTSILPSTVVTQFF